MTWARVAKRGVGQSEAPQAPNFFLKRAVFMPKMAILTLDFPFGLPPPPEREEVTDYFSKVSE